MKRFSSIFNKKFTLGTIISILVSFIFAVLLRYLYQYLYLIDPIKGGINIYDLSFFGIIITFKFIFSILLEYFLEDKFFIPLSDIFVKPNSNILMMEKDNAQGSSSEKYKGKSQASSSKNQASSSNKPPELGLEDDFKLQDNISENLETQQKMIDKLRDIKSKGVKFYGYKGNLDIEVPSEFTPEEGAKTAKEVGVIDRILQTKFSEYKELKKKDSIENNSKWGNIYGGLRKLYKTEYKNLFEENSNE